MRGVESKEAKIVMNLITVATGFSVQKNAKFLMSLALASQTPTPMLKRSLSELNYLTEVLGRVQEAILETTFSDQIEDWRR